MFIIFAYFVNFSLFIVECIVALRNIEIISFDWCILN